MLYANERLRSNRLCLCQVACACVINGTVLRYRALARVFLLALALAHCSTGERAWYNGISLTDIYPFQLAACAVSTWLLQAWLTWVLSLILRHMPLRR